MDLKTFAKVLFRRKITIAATVIVTVILTALMVSRAEKTYEATVTLRLATSVSGSLTAVDYEVVYADRLMNTYAEIATSAPIVEEITAELDLADTPDFEVAIEANTELMRITALHGEAEVAALSANALAVKLIEDVNEAAASGEAARNALTVQLARFEDELVQARQDYDAAITTFGADSPQAVAAARTLEGAQDRYATLVLQIGTREAIQANSLTFVEPAETPTSPSSPRSRLLLAMGGMAGMIAGLGLAFLEESLDSTLHAVSDVEALTGTYVPVLGLIPAVGPRAMLEVPTGVEDEESLQSPVWGEATARSSSTTSHFAEAFRRLRAAIAATDSHGELASIMVVSAEDGAGKSTLVAHLAHAFARSGMHVVVVDCNAHSPRLHSIFQLSNDFGLFDLANADAARRLSPGSRAMALQTAHDPVSSSSLPAALEFDPLAKDMPSLVQGTETPGLHVITSGESRSDSTDFLGSTAMERLVKQLEHEYDLVLLDTAALLTSADSVVLGPLADGLLFVVALGKTDRESMNRGLSYLESIRANIVGVVVNRDTGL